MANVPECFTGSDYLCQNHRCIPAQLHCDGFDHCGDNSDEPDTCTRGQSLFDIASILGHGIFGL